MNYKVDVRDKRRKDKFFFNKFKFVMILKIEKKKIDVSLFFIIFF